MRTPTIAVIDPFHPRITETIRNALPEGWSLSVTKGPSEDERAAALAEAEVAVVMATPMPRSLLERAPRLRFIQKLGAGVDRIDTRCCEERRVGLARLHAGNAIPVAEHTLLLMLAACRNLPRLDAQTRAGRWDKEEVRGENRHLHGKTVGIVGFGAIGRQVARLLSGFGVEIVYYDPVRAEEVDEAALKARYLPLDDLVAEADVVTLHLPLMPQTANMISAERIQRMKPGALLVNAARGGLVDEAALADALRSGHLFGAALDAFSEEPPAGNPLLGIENTVVTPHCAGATIDNFASVAARGVENVRRFLDGEPLPQGDIVLDPR
ncbi:2-hydroxyacid dehydrogenase [Roseitranquillus sediminis]|uniref:2-hydroxyacid dehydrogenase n=1 Tax=Roseitranquillus sediminis TaxID=2809051 RepID=UPI001D0C700C|nr:2-hydroxyacid dehydrogenase [Roseitranquillus sediminis]MBM9592989.1 2-hydroxyacid dehydrogenase [Roseitranquillus sediminis]